MIRTACSKFLLASLTLVVVSSGAFAAEPAGLPPVQHPKDNLPTPEKIALGKQLFHLVVANPVMLVVVEHWDQDVEVGQQLG